jgi:hypothetical protein
MTDHQLAEPHMANSRLDRTERCARGRRGVDQPLWRPGAFVARRRHVDAADGRIIEEVVYADTAPLQALQRGET